MRIVIAGGGITGLAAALALARASHRVVLVERDRLETGDPQDAPQWSRRGVSHFLLPHAFLPRGRREMLRAFPDIYDSLLAVGAFELDAGRKLRGPRIDQDGESSICVSGVRLSSGLCGPPRLPSPESNFIQRKGSPGCRGRLARSRV